MAYQNNDDNIYPVGAFVFAKESPTIRLQIRAYNQRIYYCQIVDDEAAKQKAYYEHELLKSDKIIL